MTDQQKYAEVLKELGALLADKNTTISCQKWQIEQLKEKLAAAEQERDETEVQLLAAQEEIAELKGGAA